MFVGLLFFLGVGRHDRIFLVWCWTLKSGNISAHMPQKVPGKPSALFVRQKLLVLGVKLPKKIGHLAFQVETKYLPLYRFNPLLPGKKQAKKPPTSRLVPRFPYPHPNSSWGTCIRSPNNLPTKHQTSGGMDGLFKSSFPSADRILFSEDGIHSVRCQWSQLLVRSSVQGQVGWPKLVRVAGSEGHPPHSRKLR